MDIRNHVTFANTPLLKGLNAGLAMTPAKIIETVMASGIKGRGGAGFPAGLKWKLAAEAEGTPKYVICNADEGEPGTFKDRVILAEWPDLVFEGMTLAGYAIGANEGIVYLRGEYSYLRESLEQKLAARREAGLLGKDAGKKKGFTFDIRIAMGNGAYICGEESALIESLEGNRGESRNRPPFPVAEGLYGKPTVVNNVETLAWISVIMAKGAEWFKSIGTEKSSGFKLLSISGDVERPGVYEFPMGTKISAILEAAGAENPKAAVVGGASGVLVPAAEFDRAISYEDVSTGGSIIVFGAQRDLLQAAENFQEFFADESCGQCTICRMGNIKLLEGIRLLKNGRCSTKYLRELCALGESMQAASKCGLGQSSPNMFLSIIKHFEPEVLGRPHQDDDQGSTRKRTA
jgi:[NiFe] hydrogenase diaphorase moiety large subunit